MDDWDQRELQSLTLYRAANDSYIEGGESNGATSFARTREHAELYLNARGFGGSKLFRVKVNIDPNTVLDLYEAHNPEKALAMATGTSSDGRAIESQISSVSERLLARGIHWVRLRDVLNNEGFEEWAFVGPTAEGDGISDAMQALRIKNLPGAG